MDFFDDEDFFFSFFLEEKSPQNVKRVALIGLTLTIALHTVFHLVHSFIHRFGWFFGSQSFRIQL